MTFTLEGFNEAARRIVKRRAEELERDLAAAIARGSHYLEVPMGGGGVMVYDLRTLDADATGVPRND